MKTRTAMTRLVDIRRDLEECADWPETTLPAALLIGELGLAIGPRAADISVVLGVVGYAYYAEILVRPMEAMHLGLE